MSLKSILPLVSLVVLASACGKGGSSEFSRVAGSDMAEPAAREGLFPQLVDHDAGKNSAVFQQRFFRESKFAQGEDAPVFLYICGEGPCSYDEMMMTTSARAERFHAHIVALEHRYYGKSFPVSDLRVENLRYLSVEQALEDLVVFVRAMQAEGLTGKWIASGGSYPGVLSAYLRLKHPELVVGALASSAPVRAKEDFEEYDLHIAKVLGPDCGKAQRDLIGRIDLILDAKETDPEAYAKLMTDFGADPATDASDFANGLSYPLGGLAQYGSPTQAEYCQVVQSPDPMAALASYVKTLEGEQEPGSEATGVVSTGNLMAMMHRPEGEASATDLPPEDTVGGRSWLWQMCTEFGFLPMAARDRSQSVYSKQLTLDVVRRYCTMMFGLEGPVDTTKINTRYYEPLAQGRASRILFTNGSNDPWSELSFTGAVKGKDVYSYVIDGGHHCDDLGPDFPEQSDSLKGAKAKFDGLVTRWLKSY